MYLQNSSQRRARVAQAIKCHAVALETFQMTDFSGGLNTQDGAFNLQPNEAQDLMNITLTQRGALQQRQGKTRFDASGFPSTKRAEHIRPWYFGSSKFLMASIDGSIYSFSTAGVGTLRQAGTAGTVWWFEQGADASGNNYLYCANGVDATIRLDQAFVSSAWSIGKQTKMFRVWKNRMVVGSAVATEASRIYFSNIFDPNGWDLATNFMDVRASEDDVDPITWIEILGDSLIVFKKRSVWRLTGDVPSVVAQRIGDPGCEDRFQSAVSEGRVYYWARNGLWSTDGVETPRMETRKVENYLSVRMNYSAVGKIRVYSARDRRIFIAFPTGVSADNTTLMEVVTGFTLSDKDGTERSPVVMHDWPVASMATFRPAEVDVMMAGASNAGRLHQLFSGTNDDGVAIASVWKSAWLPINSQEPWERVRRVNVVGDGQAVVNTYKDFGPVSFSAPLSISGPVDPYWDGGTWGGGTWDAVSPTGFVRFRPEQRGRYHAIELKNSTLNKSFSVVAIELAYRKAGT